jgi:hypothetical protein
MLVLWHNNARKWVVQNPSSLEVVLGFRKIQGCVGYGCRFPPGSNYGCRFPHVHPSASTLSRTGDRVRVDAVMLHCLHECSEQALFVLAAVCGNREETAKSPRRCVRSVRCGGTDEQHFGAGFELVGAGRKPSTLAGEKIPRFGSAEEVMVADQEVPLEPFQPSGTSPLWRCSPCSVRARPVLAPTPAPRQRQKPPQGL